MGTTEQKILSLLYDGKNKEEIAKELTIKVSVVDSVIKRYSDR